MVLHWLFSSKPLKQFVANRTKQIKEMLSMSQYWNHCPTTANSVDLLTRRINSHQLRTLPLWNCGPQWLLIETQWPKWKPMQVLTSFPGFSPTRPTEQERERDPGKRWSRVSQNLGDYKQTIWGRGR